MNTAYINPALMFSGSKDNSDKKSFAKEITDSNKEIREEHRVIIQEAITNDSKHEKPKPAPNKTTDASKSY